MFDPHQTKIATKRHVWNRIVTGRLMNNFIDTEGSGVGQSPAPYNTPNYPFLTEYGDALFDFAGNYLDSFQIFPRRPPWLAFEPGSPLIQRIVTNPALFDSEERINYGLAMAHMADRLDHAAFAYGELAETLGVERQSITIRDYNQAFKNGTDGAKQDRRGVYKPAIEIVNPITFYDDEADKLVEDAWYHPLRRMVSYKFDLNPNSRYFANFDNHIYYNEEDGTLRRWVPAALTNIFFNARYDWPIMRMNFYRTGMPLSNTGFMNNRATGLNYQRPKNVIEDAMHLMNLAALHGPKGENGIDFPRLLNPHTGKLDPKLTLSAYIDFHTGQENPLRIIRPGAFNPYDGSKHDPILDHGAVTDALTTAAIYYAVMDRAPWIGEAYSRQRDNKTLYSFLTRQDPHGSKWDLFSMPEREGAGEPTDGLYYFVNNDDAYGKLKRLVFLKCDGTLHTRRRGGKPPQDWSIEEWDDELKQRKNGLTRIESENYFAGAVHLDDLLEKSPRANLISAAQEKLIGADYDLITAHPQIRDRLMAAVGRQNSRMKNDQEPLAAEVMEDEIYRQFAGEVPYLLPDEIREDISKNGAQMLPVTAEKLKREADNIWRKEFQSIDDALKQLFVQFNPIDAYQDEPLRSQIHREIDEDGLTDEAVEAAQALVEFTDLCERLYNTKIKKKSWPYKAILDEIINPATNEPYFYKGKFKAETVGQAYAFRRLLRQRNMRDTDREIKRKTSEIAEGYVSQGYDQKPEIDGQRHHLLFADADTGQSGRIPVVTDEAGRVLDYDYLYAQDFKDVLQKLDRKEWKIRFHRLSAEPSTLLTIQHALLMGEDEDIPASLMELYIGDYILHMGGMPDETVTTSRFPTLYTMRHELNHNKKLQAQAHESEEAQRILTNVRRWVDKEIVKLEELKKLQSVNYIPPHEPGTDEPLDYIDHRLIRDETKPLEQDPHFTVLKAPLEVAYKPIVQRDIILPQRGLIVPNIDSRTREQINKGKPVIIKTGTGPLYTAGKSDIRLIDPNDKAFSDIIHTAHTNYAAAGQPLQADDKLFYLGIEDMHPLACSRDLNFGHQSLDLPFNHFWATVDPAFARAPQADKNLAGLFNDKAAPHRALIVPLDYCPQELVPGAPLRLREVAGNMFANLDGALGKPTGHILETQLTEVWGLKADGRQEGFPLKVLTRMIQSGKFSEQIAQEAGFLSGPHVERALRENFITAKFRTNPDKQRFLVIRWEEVNAAYKHSQNEADNQWAFIQPDPANYRTVPRAALMRHGHYPYPSEYRPLN